METALEKFSIPFIVTPEDIADGSDSFSLMTYISYFKDYVENPKRRDEILSRQSSYDNQIDSIDESSRILDVTIHDRENIGGSNSLCHQFAIRLTPKDENANDQGKIQSLIEKTEIKVKISGPRGESGIENLMCRHQLQPAEVRNPESGVFLVSFQVDHPGQYEISIFLNGNEMENSPIYSEIVADKLMMEGSGIKGGKFNGKHAEFNIQTGLKSGGHLNDINILLLNTNSEEVKVDLFDNNDGSYTAMYVPTETGQYKLTVKIWNQEICPDLMGPFFEEGVPLSSPPTVYKMQFSQTLFVTDRNGIPKSYGGDNLEARIENRNDSSIISSEINDNNDGSYTIS